MPSVQSQEIPTADSRPKTGAPTPSGSKLGSEPSSLPPGAQPARKPPKPSEVLETLGATPNRRWRKALRWGLVALVLAACVGALVLWRMRANDRPITWQTEPVVLGDIEITVDATGSLEPSASVVIGAEVSGRIASVEVDEDDRVQAGQVLARFDLDTFRNELAEAKASLAAARADVVRAQARLADATATDRREVQLSKQGIISRERVEQSKNTVQLARAELEGARAQRALATARVERVQTQLSKATVTSPIDGVVLERSVDPGATVAAAFQSPRLFTIAADLSRMELQLAIDEADIGRVEAGQRAFFAVDAWPAREYHATVTQVHLSPRVSGNVVTYVADLLVDNRDGSLRPGMTATATIHIGVAHDVRRIPVLALRFRPPVEPDTGFRFGPPPVAQQHASGSAVWVLRDDAPTRVAITSGASDGQWVEVVEGELAAGDLVIVSSDVEGGAR